MTETETLTYLGSVANPVNGSERLFLVQGQWETVGVVDLPDESCSELSFTVSVNPADAVVESDAPGQR